MFEYPLYARSRRPLQPQASGTERGAGAQAALLSGTANVVGTADAGVHNPLTAAKATASMLLTRRSQPVGRVARAATWEARVEGEGTGAGGRDTAGRSTRGGGCCAQASGRPVNQHLPLYTQVLRSASCLGQERARQSAEQQSAEHTAAARCPSCCPPHHLGVID